MMCSLKTSFHTNGKKIRLLRKEHMMAFRYESLKEQIVNAKIEPRRSQRSRISKSFGPFIAYVIESEPQTFKEAMSTPEAQMWKEVINSEIKSILSNHTWELALLAVNQLGVSEFSKEN